MRVYSGVSLQDRWILSDIAEMPRCNNILQQHASKAITIPEEARYDFYLAVRMY